MPDTIRQFGNIDIYVFDLLQRGLLRRTMRIIDAGCGGGRNILWMMRNGFDVSGCDESEAAIEQVRALASECGLHESNFRCERIEENTFENETFDAVICSAVLHFARDDDHFRSMVEGIWRLLRPGGFLFARLASDIGIEGLVEPLGQGRFALPDGSNRYLVSEERLLLLTAELRGSLAEPIKTVNIQNLRCMTNWRIIK